MSMSRIRNVSPRSFARTKHFPGTAGNPFDRFLHAFDNLERLPSILFAVILLLFSLFVNWFHPIQNIILYPFFIGDWILISLLPVFKCSFGPIKPVVLTLAILRIPFVFLPVGWNLATEIVGTLLVIYGFYIEPFRLDVHHETFTTTKFASGQYLRVVHLGDLHVERTTIRENKILRVLNELSPDLILFSGDLLNLSYLNDPQAQADVRAFLCALSAPLGVFGVSGSPAVDLPELFPKLVADTPLHWLDDQIQTIRTASTTLCLFGLSCSHNPDRDGQTLQNLITQAYPHGLDPSSFNLLLYHSPDLAPDASGFGFNLQLSGHTHGGQVRLPVYGALYTGSLYKKAFEAGRYLVNGMVLYVTRGLGMEGAIAPRVRVLCRPELIIWDLHN